MSGTYASLFTGGGLADIGAMQAGYTPIWGVEYIHEIAEIARANGLNVLTANVLDCDPAKFARPDWLHASPPCPNFSVAKQNGVETALDIALAEKVAEFIATLRPQNVTIENVPAYRKSKSYRAILRALEDAGYMYDARVLCAADFGVPQTRRRLIVRAVLGGLVPNLPAPTPWRGWYAAIEDILDTLLESQFADWQLARLPEFCDGGLFTPNKRDDKPIYTGKDAPAFTVTSNRNMKSNVKAFLVNENRTSTAWAQTSDLLSSESPCFTVSANGHAPRAFLVGDQQGQYSRDDQPAQTVRANSGGGTAPRALLLSGCGISTNQNIIFEKQDPCPTVTASEIKRPTRAWLSQGRVVKMTVQAMGRFQTLPDWYQGATMRIIGNGVPCKLMRAIGEAWQ